MRAWKFRSCPRCGGDLFLDREIDNSWHEHCLQCSYRHELRNIEEFHSESVQRKSSIVSQFKARREEPWPAQRGLKDNRDTKLTPAAFARRAFCEIISQTDPVYCHLTPTNMI